LRPVDSYLLFQMLNTDFVSYCVSFRCSIVEYALT
jgi:hypothetical protein